MDSSKFAWSSKGLIEHLSNSRCLAILQEGLSQVFD